MSRSRRLHPYITDQNSGRPQHGESKRVAAKAVRNAKEVPSGGSYKKVSQSYKIRDWDFYCPKNPKARRK